VAVRRVIVPSNYGATLVGLRHRLGLSQQQLVAKIAARPSSTNGKPASGSPHPSSGLGLNVCNAELSTRVHAQMRDAILWLSIADWIVEGISYQVPSGGVKPPASIAMNVMILFREIESVMSIVPDRHWRSVRRVRSEA
jgi:hypothetical protein